VDAFWEKRNMGVSCAEVSIDTSDTVADIARLSELSADYRVVKCLSKMVDVMFALENYGYRFIEAILELHHNLKSVDSYKKGAVGRIADGVSVALMNDADIDELNAQIRSGIFESDRVYLDPAFTHEQAANRYIGWVRDEINHGALVFKGLVEDKPFGFFTLYKDDANIAHASITGVYKGYENSGIGLGLYWHMVNQAAQLGCKAMTGGGVAVSCNNVRSLKACLAVGFEVKRVIYVYVKHAISERKQKMITVIPPPPPGKHINLVYITFFLSYLFVERGR
jgi:hypothetical protein